MLACNCKKSVLSHQEGKSLLEWTQEKAETLSDVKPSMKNEYKKEKDTARNSLRILSDFRPTSVSHLIYPLCFFFNFYVLWCVFDSVYWPVGAHSTHNLCYYSVCLSLSAAEMCGLYWCRKAGYVSETQKNHCVQHGEHKSPTCRH